MWVRQWVSDCLHCTRTMRCRCNMLLYYFINAFRFAFVNVDILDCAHSRPTKNSENAFFSLRSVCFFCSVRIRKWHSASGLHSIWASLISSAAFRFHLHNHFNQPSSNGSTRAPCPIYASVRLQSSTNWWNIVIKWARPRSTIYLLLWHQFDFFSEFIYRQTIKRMQTNYERV